MVLVQKIPGGLLFCAWCSKSWSEIIFPLSPPFCYQWCINHLHRIKFTHVPCGYQKISVFSEKGLWPRKTIKIYFIITKETGLKGKKKKKKKSRICKMAQQVRVLIAKYNDLQVFSDLCATNKSTNQPTKTKTK